MSYIPRLGQKGAPEKFKGGHAHVINFVTDFESLIVQCQLSLFEAKRLVLRYCSTSVCDTIQGLPAYAAIVVDVPPQDPTNPVSPHPVTSAAQWIAFTTELKRIYGAGILAHKYREADLLRYTYESKKKPIHTFLEFIAYERGYRAVGGWLRRNNKIDDRRFLSLFFLGLNRETRKVLREQIIRANPAHNQADPFTKAQILAAASQVFAQDRFDDSGDEYAEPELMDSDSDSDYTGPKRAETPVPGDAPAPRPPTPPVKKKRVRISGALASKPDSDDFESLDNLISRLSRLNINDADFTPTLAAISARNAVLASTLLQMKVSTGQGPSSAPAAGPSTLPAPQSPRAPTRPATPPARPYTPPLRSAEDFQCFFCNEFGHQVKGCPHREHLLNTGVLGIKNDRTCWADGGNISRKPHESLLQAIERKREADRQKRGGGSAIHLLSVFPESSDDEYTGDIYADIYLGPARSNTRHRVVPYEVPTAPQKGKAPMREVTPAVPAAAVPFNSRPATSNAPVHIPYDVPPVIISQDDDVSMQEPAQKGQLRRKPSKDGKVSTPRTPNPFLSELMRTTDPETVYKKILGQDAGLSVGEVLGIAPGIAKKLEASVKMSRMPKEHTPAIAATLPADGFVDVLASGRTHNLFSYGSHTKEHLPRLRITIAGRSLIAILDSGSELNLWHERIWALSQLPIDREHNLKMGDANGGISISQGLVTHAEIALGDVITKGSFFVGQFPFDVLLGRPWIRANRVDMIERDEGTFVIIKRSTSHPDHSLEILAVPDQRYQTHESLPPTTHQAEHVQQRLHYLSVVQEPIPNTNSATDLAPGALEERPDHGPSSENASEAQLGGELSLTS